MAGAFRHRVETKFGNLVLLGLSDFRVHQIRALEEFSLRGARHQAGNSDFLSSSRSAAAKESINALLPL
jgi:hypothetical protein